MISRIYGVFLRYFYTITGMHQLSEMFFWPMMDILLWGLTMTWLQHEKSAPNLALLVLTALIFWQIVSRAAFEIAVNLLQEFWNRNLVNLFSTPLSIAEWSLGCVILCILKSVVSLSFAGLLVFLLYELNVFLIGWYFLPFAALLLMSGWMLGFLSSSLIMRYGQKIEMVAWMLPYFFAPFSAVFYPVSSLPVWAQTFAWCLPMTYTFEGMRAILNQGIFDLRDFGISLALNLLYLAGAILIFKFSFARSMAKGLARLE